MTPKAAKLRALLALLLLKANEPISSDELIERLWDTKPPATAKNTLQRYVSALRKLLPDETLVTQPPGYLLRVEPGQLDLRRFEQVLEEGRQALVQDDDPGRAADLLVRALGLWRGPALADFAYESWAQQESRRLEELRLGALEDRVEAQLALGQQTELVAELQTLVADQPLRERLRGQLMLALYRSGRQAEALEAYRQARETLVGQLGIDPSPELQTLYKQILNQEELLAAPSASAVQPVTNLPEPTTQLIGRERELAEVRDLLRRKEVRLVTLTGTGGTGKTRLALELARHLLPEFADGAFLVELAAITAPEHFAAAVAQALGVREQDKQLDQTLTDYLSGRELLLVLDNLEQLLEAAPKLADLVAHTREMTVLVTSRTRLHITAEHEYPLSPLALPDLEHLPDLERLSEYEAIALFIERARAVRPHFELTNTNARALAEICTRLDGLPLALELAAARITFLSPEALLDRLGERLKLLTGGPQDLPERQQTLGATIDWSYGLLSREEQQLFERIAVFIGGLTIAAVEAVCDIDGDLGLDVLEGLGSLVSQSLLRYEEGLNNEPRFVMLETLHEYARARLELSPDAERLYVRHAEYFLSFAEQMKALFRAREQTRAVEALRTETANLRNAADWLHRAGPKSSEMRLAYALHQMGYETESLAEAQTRTEAALANSEKEDPVLRAHLLRILAVLALRQGHARTGLGLAEEAVKLAAEDKPVLAQCLLDHAACANWVGEREVAQVSFEAGLAIAREIDDDDLIRAGLANLADFALTGEDHVLAKRLSLESLEHERRAEDNYGQAIALQNYALAAINLGEYTDAVPRALEALQIARPFNPEEFGNCLALVGTVAAFAGDAVAAASLVAAAERLLEEVGSQLGPAERRTCDRALVVCEGRIGQHAFHEAWRTGRNLGADAAVELALRSVKQITAKADRDANGQRRPKGQARS